LLVVADNAGHRRLGLAALDLAVTLPSGATVALSSSEWASGTVSPQGHRYLESFELTDGLPTWRWRIGDVVIEREVAMAHGRSCVGVVHRVVAAPAPVTLMLTALCTWRDAGAERRASDGEMRMESVDDGVVIEDAYRVAGPNWSPRGQWWHDVYAREEAARGFTAAEDLWCAGTFTDTVAPGATTEICAWAGDVTKAPARAGALLAAARKRARAVVAAAAPVDDIDASLALAADAFIIKGPAVVAGYPWFGSSLRNTMTAYEGLFLRTGRADEGAQLLRRHAATVLHRRDAATSADSPLWFVHAVDRHLAATGDTQLVKELSPVLDGIIAGYLEGSTAPWPGRVDPVDGLVALPPSAASATWMNVRRDDFDGSSITPRDGKPVELNALWINALAAVARMRESRRQDAAELWRHHDAAATAFAKRFVTSDGSLSDVVEGTEAGALRPNQLLAFSLPYPAVTTPDPAAVRVVGERLATPLGIRTLAPGDDDYRGGYTGGALTRGEAYHQGSAWPWLIGAYVDACQAVGESIPGVLRGLEAHLSEWGVGSVSELVDGDAPHAARGCPFSARSVAELIRARAVLRTPVGRPSTVRSSGTRRSGTRQR
jgi:predicted glycogen debranching enzyme